MTVIQEKFNINSKAFGDVIDITSKIENILFNSNIEKGLINITLNFNSCGILLLKDIKEFEKINKLTENILKSNAELNEEFYSLAPLLKGMFFKNSLTLLIENNKILFDNQERIFFVDFNQESKQRQVFVSLIF